MNQTCQDHGNFSKDVSIVGSAQHPHMDVARLGDVEEVTVMEDVSAMVEDDKDEVMKSVAGLMVGATHKRMMMDIWMMPHSV